MMLHRAVMTVGRRTLGALVLVVLLGALAGGSAAQGRTVGQMRVVDPPTVTGNRVSVGVRIEGVNPQALIPLSAVNFSVSEPAAELSVAREARTPHAVALLAVAGFGSDLDLIQASLRAYTDQYVQDGDRVLLITLDGRGLTETETDDPSALSAAIGAMQISRNYPILSEAVRPALAWLAEQPEGETVRFGVLFASYLNVNEDLTESAAFAGAGVPLHVVQPHTFRDSFTTRMRQMAENTGGLFIDNKNGLFSQGLPPQASASLKVLYDALAATRDVFTVSYRAVGSSLETQPDILLTARLTLTQSVSTRFQYARAFAPPTVSFSQQTIAPIRRPTVGPSGLLYDLDEQPVAVRVAFEDNVPRGVESIQLDVLDAVTGLVLGSSVVVEPQTDPSGSYRVPWSLVDFLEPGRLYTVTLRATVTDELGLSGSAEQQAAVTVAALPATATPTATLTPTPTATPSITPTPEASPTPDVTPSAVALVAGGGGEQGTAQPLPPPTPAPSAPPAPSGAPDPLVWLLGGMAAVFGVLTLGLALALWRARRAPARATTEGDAAIAGMSLMDIPTPLPDAPNNDPATIQNRSQLYGRLLVKRGLPAGEILIMAEEFVVGRKQDSDVQYTIDKPFVSPRHCLITHKRGRFTIRDLNSKNGTYVNGERLHPDRDTIVPVGSEVAVTQNIVFELWDPNTVVKVDYQGDAIRSNRVTEDNNTRTNPPTRANSSTVSSIDGEPVGDDYSPV
jgi:hypothetical protein